MASKRKSLEQFAAQRLELEVRSVPLAAIDFDPLNPNELEPEMYEQLKADIRDYGFWQPVLVTPQGDRFRMVDGEHRARIVGELGGTSIPAVIADEWQQDEARFRLITMNRFKGAFKPLPLSEMLATLAESHSEAELRHRIGMDEAALRDALSLTKFTDEPGDALREELDRERREAPVRVMFVCNQRDSEIIERVVSAAATAKMDRGQALAAVCREWERAHKSRPKEASHE